jgi:Type II secretion system (T2SS), protein E, N-terminal domain
VSSSNPELPGIPRSSDGTPNWAADTDPVGPPLLQREERMSTAEFGDPNLGQAPAPAPAPDGLLSPLTISPAAPVEPLVQPAPLATAQPVAPVGSVQAPAVPVQDMRDVPLGTLIFRAGLLTEEHLEEALHDGMQRGKRLGEVLLERGLVSEVDLGRLLAGQKGLRFVELDAAAVDPAAVRLLPVEKARLYSMLPVGFEDGLPVVAVADPSNDLVVENVRRALNCEPHLVVAGREAIHRQIELAYGALSNGVEPVAQAAQEPVSAPVAPVAVDPQMVAPAAPPAPPVAQPEPGHGEGVWLGTPEPTIQLEQPLSYQAPEPQPVFVPNPVQPLVEPVQPAFEQPAVEQPAPEPVSISYAPVETVIPEPVMAAEPIVVSEPVVAPEPLVVPEPTVAQQVATPAPVFVPEPVAETPAPVFEQTVTEPDADVDTTWSVSLRLTDGEQLEIGVFRTGEEAREHAQSVVRQISSDHSWPFFEGRFIRPDAIISVDLAAPEGGRWLGSSARRQWASPTAG